MNVELANYQSQVLESGLSNLTVMEGDIWLVQDFIWALWWMVCAHNKSLRSIRPLSLERMDLRLMTDEESNEASLQHCFW